MIKMQVNYRQTLRLVILLYIGVELSVPKEKMYHGLMISNSFDIKKMIIKHLYNWKTDYE